MSVTSVVVAIVPAVEPVSGGASIWIASIVAVEDGPAGEMASMGASAAPLMSTALAAVAVEASAAASSVIAVAAPISSVEGALALSSLSSNVGA